MKRCVFHVGILIPIQNSPQNSKEVPGHCRSFLGVFGYPIPCGVWTNLMYINVSDVCVEITTPPHSLPSPVVPSDGSCIIPISTDSYLSVLIGLSIVVGLSATSILYIIGSKEY